MIVNVVVVVLIILFGLYYLSKPETVINSPRNRKSYISIVSVILILQSGLRHVAVGADTYAYFLSYERAVQISWRAIWLNIRAYYMYGLGKDPGYAAFEKLSHYIAPNYQLFLLLIALLFFLALGFFLYKNTRTIRDIMFAFVLYSSLFYSFFSITGHRQTVATAAALLGFELIKKRKLIPFLIIIAIASTIHQSVLIFIPFYFFYKIKLVRVFYISVILMLPVLFFYRIDISNFFKEAGGYEHYGIYEGAGTFVFSFMLIMVALTGMIRYSKTIKVFPDTKGFFVALAMAIFFLPLTWVNPSAMRVVQYFSIFLMVLIPRIVYSFSLESRQLRSLVYAISLSLLLGFFIRTNINREYKFFWQKMELGENYKRHFF